MVMLVMFRAIQGIGAGAIQPIASTVIGDIYTPAERARVQGYLSSVFGVSAIIGPALGAFLVEHVHWAVVFWVNLPIGAVSIAMFAVYLPERVERRQHRIDYLGAILLIVGVGAPMLALVQARSSRRRRHRLADRARRGDACSPSSCTRPARREPMVPFRLWRNRVIALANFGIFGTGSTMMAVSAFLPTYVQGVMGRSPAIAGLVLGCMSVSWMFASFAAGRLMIRTSYRLAAALGGVALAIGAAMLSQMQPSSGIALGGGRLAWSWASAWAPATPRFWCRSRRAWAGASAVWPPAPTCSCASSASRLARHSAARSSISAFSVGCPMRRTRSTGCWSRRCARGLGAGEITRLTDAVAASLHEVYLIATLLAVLTFVAALGFPAHLSPVRPAAPAAR